MSNASEQVDLPLYQPSEDTLAALFDSVTKARRGLAAVQEKGFQPGRARLLVFDSKARALADDASRDDPDAIAELATVLSESFSDDEKLSREIDRALTAGGVLLELNIANQTDRRQELGALLRANHARAVYYWGALTTERL